MDTVPTVSVSQYLTLAVFMLLLAGIWYLVQRNREALTHRTGKGRRISVLEVTALSPVDRAMILAVDGQEFLVLRSKGTAPVITQLSERAGQ